MNTAERERVLFQVNAAWRSMPDATLAVWSDHLANMEYNTASNAVRKMQQSLKMPPAIADLYEFYKAVTPTAVTKVIEAPVDMSARARAHAIVEAFVGRKTVPITASMLDAAGVSHWRRRLDDAMRDDVDRGMGRKNYDLAWLNVKNELSPPDVWEGDNPEMKL